VEIEALPPEPASLTLPFVLLVLSIFLVALGLKFLGHTTKPGLALGFGASFTGIALLAGSLIPIVSAMASAQDIESYKTHLYEDHGLKLSENSALSIALRDSNEESVIPVVHEVIATECQGKETVKAYDLWVTRKSDTIYLFDQNSKPFTPCPIIQTPMLKVK
jgi:hypothetical protein